MSAIASSYRTGVVSGAREEFEAAEAANDKFIQCDQYEAAAALVDAYDTGDSEKLGEALKKSPFKYIMNSIAVIARKLQMQEGKKPRKKPTPAAAGGAEAAEEDEKDEDDFT